MKCKPIVICFALVLGAIVAATILVRGYDSFLKTRRVVRHETTVRALSRLRGYLTEYMIIHGSLPGPTLHDALDALEKEGDKYYEMNGVRISEPSVDAWGHAIIYELHGPTHAFVRSIGENGVDENGKGDDIELEVPLR
jgi:hypothetical protein